MNSPTVFNTTFFASIKSEYANYGISGYKIGSTTFRSLASLKDALDTATAKDFCTYRYLEIQIAYNKGNVNRVAQCTASNYNDVLDAIEADLEDQPMTLEDLLEE